MADSTTLYFDQNMALLKKNHRSAFDAVSRHLGHVQNVEIMESGNHKLNLKARVSDTDSILIHDPGDPGRETENFLSMVPEVSTGVVVMFGMGLGYAVIDLLKKRKKIQYLILFELNVEFFVMALRHMDLQDTLADSRLIICLERPENLAEIMGSAHKAFMLEDIHTLSLTTCCRVNGEYALLAPEVADYISAFNADGNTKLAYGRTFIENRLKHLTSMHHDRKLEELDGKFKDIPALIVAAGPSLDKNIDQIQKAVGRAVIICVDSALPALLAKNIIPDFVTSIDYQELTWEKIAGVSANPACRETSLICTTWITEFVPKRFPAKNVFWAFSRNTLENWINNMMGGKISIGGAGTVAHLNFVSANLMGCDPIIFVGQDLAFSNKKGHSSNVVLSSNESVNQKFAMGRDILMVKGAVEPEVPTDRQMVGYLRTFEKMVKESDNCVINATEGGAFIKGAEHMPLASAMDQYCRTMVKIDLEDPGDRIDLLSSMESAVIDINKAERVVKKAEKISGPVRKKMMGLKKQQEKIVSFSHLPQPLQKKISDLDDCHKKLDNMPLFSLFDEITMEGLRQDEREKKAIEAIEGKPEKYFEWLSRSLVRIDKINKIRIKNLSWLKEQLNEIIRYHRKENHLAEMLKRDIPDKKLIFEMADLYCQTDNFILLEKFIDAHKDHLLDTPGLGYYQGVIELYRDNYQVVEKKIQNALKKDKGYAEKFHDKMYEISTFYLEQSRLRMSAPSAPRSPLMELFLMKALRSCPDNKEVISVIRKIAREDFEQIDRVFKSNNGKIVDDHKKMIEKWVNLLAAAPQIMESMEKDLIYGFHFFCGKMFMEEQNYQAALEKYKIACLAVPDTPDIYIAIADLCFEAQAFDSGLEYLKKAVDLDRNYAVYWYNMGNNLRAQEDYKGAVLAYEQYFMALPEHFEVLKDIGDCYAKLGQLEAARESYKQYKKILNRE